VIAAWWFMALTGLLCLISGRVWMPFTIRYTKAENWAISLFAIGAFDLAMLMLWVSLEWSRPMWGAW
jgi:hypothetical protein